MKTKNNLFLFGTGILLAGIVSLAKMEAQAGSKTKGFCAPAKNLCGISSSGTKLRGIWVEGDDVLRPKFPDDWIFF